MNLSYTYILIGNCVLCGKPLLVPRFSKEPVSTECACVSKQLGTSGDVLVSPPAKEHASGRVTDEDIDSIDRAQAFDDLVIQVQFELTNAIDLAAAPDALLLQMSADLGSAQAAFLDGATKAAFSLLLRVAATMRHLVSTNSKFADFLSSSDDEDV